jgi:hypothetical protein
LKGSLLIKNELKHKKLRRKLKKLLRRLRKRQLRKKPLLRNRRRARRKALSLIHLLSLVSLGSSVMIVKVKMNLLIDRTEEPKRDLEAALMKDIMIRIDNLLIANRLTVIKTEEEMIASMTVTVNLSHQTATLTEMGIIHDTHPVVVERVTSHPTKKLPLSQFKTKTRIGILLPLEEVVTKMI